MKAFVAYLAGTCNVSASSQNQAFNALLFFFRHVIKKDFGENHNFPIEVLGSVMDIGHTTGPLVAGFMAASFGFGAAFIGAGVVLALAAFVFLTAVSGPSAATQTKA